MHYLADYGFFLAKISTVVIAALILLAGMMAILMKGKAEAKLALLRVKLLNKKYEDFATTLNEEVLPKKEFKRFLKAQKEQDKKEKKARKRVFVLDFQGDLRASNLDSFREEVTALLMVAQAQDEIVVKIESAGGLVYAYGLAASQLDRIKQHGMILTVAVDKVAASGGYLMACVANKIIAAPFAIIGSLGVVAQLPNFHRFLKRHDIDFEQVTAGEYKRTLTLFGENTEKARDKFREELNQVHDSFKEYVLEHRHGVDIDAVATGEHWLAAQAKKLNLVDELMTSDDYLLRASKECDVFEVSYEQKKPFLTRLLEKTANWRGL
ncbi:MAG: protease SohB [Gammaproteobacteria bacterium]|nr:protease SohB [Gammaproteobacteria bacterium]